MCPNLHNVHNHYKHDANMVQMICADNWSVFICRCPCGQETSPLCFVHGQGLAPDSPENEWNKESQKGNNAYFCLILKTILIISHSTLLNEEISDVF